MSTAEMSRLFAILSLIALAGSVVTIVLAVMFRSDPDSTAGELFETIRARAVWLAFLVALITTLGSLYLSEVAHFVPCVLCWYQRICMYPLALVLLIGGMRRDRDVWVYVLPPAVVGLGFSVYHTQLQAFPRQHGPFCKIAEPCTVRYVWEFGFVSIPFMALTAFAFIIVMMLLLRSSGPVEDDAAQDDAPGTDDTSVLPAGGTS
jgi:disulfide bond formation protein DsbB